MFQLHHTWFWFFIVFDFVLDVISPVSDSTLTTCINIFYGAAWYGGQSLWLL